MQAPGIVYLICDVDGEKVGRWVERSLVVGWGLSFKDFFPSFGTKKESATLFSNRDALDILGGCFCAVSGSL